MAHNIGIYYNEAGIREIMKGPAIANLEQEIMTQRLSQVKAEFLMHFGFDGKFQLKKFDTKSRRSRTAFMIIGADAKTNAALKKEPGWLAKFV